MRLLSVVFSAAALLGVSATAAHADYTPASPTPANKSIKPGVSIGGVKLGMSYADALKAWGPGSTCQQDDIAYTAANPGQTIDRSTGFSDCAWNGAPGDGKGTIFIKDGKVRSVQIFAAEKTPGHPTAKGAISKFVLKLGKYKITLGVSMSVIYKALPKAHDNGGGPTITKGGVEMGFSSSASHLYQISLSYPGDS